MDNPFDYLAMRLNAIDAVLHDLPRVAPHLQPEIIDRPELMRRLGIKAESTIIEYEKKGKIPAIRIGANVRYNWPSVIKQLEEGKPGK